jgi:hypothetical protein
VALKINDSTSLEVRSLTVDSQGVRFRQTAFIGGRRRFRFNQIDCVLMSPTHVLSFQVGSEVFSVATKPQKRQHQETIEALLYHVRASA